MTFPVPSQERERLARLHALGILDTGPEPAFDRVVHLASQIFDTPIAAISLVDLGRQWFKASVGLSVPETPRCDSFCAHALMGDEVMVVCDATADARFASNPLVTNDPGIRFYAGAPLITSDGLRLGALCIIDSVSRAPLSGAQEAVLRGLADAAMHEIERQLDQAQTAAMQAALRESEERFRAAMRDAAIGMAVVALDGRWLEANDALVRLLGYPRAELLAGRFQELTHPLDLECDLEHLERLTAGEIGSYSIEKRYIRRDGSVVWALLNVSLVRGESAQPLYFVSQIQDLTEIHSLAAELVSEKQQLQELATRLDEARSSAETANRVKSEFLAIMSHELRTPLNGVLGFAQLLRHPAFGHLNEKQREFVDHIEVSGNLLLSLVTDILELSKVEAGHIDIDIRPVDPVTVLKAALTNVAQLARDAGIALDVNAPVGPVPAILADATRLAQVLINLLGNAIKYNRPGGSVAFACERDGGDVVITITDTGTGIAADRQLELFEPFARLGAEHTHIEGHGIGLALCRKLTELIGGTIGARSVEGEGSTFWVRFTAAENDGSGGRPSSACPAFSPISPFRLLHIEDNPVTRNLVRDFASAFEYLHVTGAATGAEGLRLARAVAPDAILLDLNLPDVGGWKVIEALKGDPLTAGAPTIVSSASASPADMARAAEVGIAAFLPKPVDLARLAEVLTGLQGEQNPAADRNGPATELEEAALACDRPELRTVD